MPFHTKWKFLIITENSILNTILHGLIGTVKLDFLKYPENFMLIKNTRQKFVNKSIIWCIFVILVLFLLKLMIYAGNVV